MISIRKADERGHVQHGWLESYHTFSFANYFDPRFQGFRALRVINEDWFQPKKGFGTHPHEDMEILTYVLEGALAHRDNLGHGSIIQAGEFQRMTAGTGIAHSEFNASDIEPVHLYQIWLLPERSGLEPSYEQKRFDNGQHAGGVFWPVATRDGRDGSLRINQDLELSLARLKPAEEVVYPLRAGRHAWLQVSRGDVELHGHKLTAGDGAALSREPAVKIKAEQAAEVLLFDLA